MSASASAAVAFELALQLERRLSQFDGSIDPHWRRVAEPSRELLRLATSGVASAERLGLLAFESLCGPLPPLEALGSPTGRWCLMPRAALLPRLCALALLLRPGVLRCCVRREPREALRTVLGAPVHQSLRDASSRGAAVPAWVADWPPVQWAAVGCMDLSRAGAWPSRSMRRLVRLALSPAVACAPHWPAQRLGIDIDEAVSRVETLFGSTPEYESEAWAP